MDARKSSEGPKALRGNVDGSWGAIGGKMRGGRVRVIIEVIRFAVWLAGELMRGKKRGKAGRWTALDEGEGRAEGGAKEDKGGRGGGED